MIKVFLQGRIGNQLFQYAFAYVTAKKNKTKFLFEIDRNKLYLKAFKLNFPFNLFSNSLIFRIYCQLVKRVNMKQSADLMDCKQKIYLPEEPNNIFYKGFFQDATYFHPYKKDLLHLFSFKKRYKKHFENKYGEIFKQNKTLVICIRTGIDYKNFQLPDYNYPYVFLPTDWFIKVISSIRSDYEKIIIISDDINEAKLILGEADSFQYIEDAPEMQFQMLMNADGCVISNSSYAWWGAYLNTKPNKKVYAPLNWAGYNIGIEYPAGIMTEEFIWIA